ncbi:MAG: nicotinate-nucleotide--dimethylbenzimidazole phosphoribosyltransferase [Bosea sp. (in: a-proteobacteria)]
MTSSGLPFDDVRALIKSMPGADMEAMIGVRERDRELTKPAGSLGRLEELASWMAAWQGKKKPSCDRPLVCVFAANHGVAVHGVSAFPQSVTQAMLENFSAGGAAINQICAAFDFGFKVFDLALDLPTEDFTVRPALDEKSAVATMAFGMEAISGGTDLLILGEMGIGNTTSAAAIYAALYGGGGGKWAGRGTGVDDDALARKILAIDTALHLHRAHFNDPLEILRRLGGREIAALCGAIIAARLQRIPVVLDGYVVTAAAAILHALDPRALDHCVAGHLSAEGAHREVLVRLGKVPLLALDMRLGEASGAAVAATIIKAAVATHNNMATFSQANVARKG